MEARELIEYIGKSEKKTPVKIYVKEKGYIDYAAGAGWYAVKRRPDAPAKEGNASVNLILPYAEPCFIDDGDAESMRKYSITCLENAADIAFGNAEGWQA